MHTRERQATATRQRLIQSAQRLIGLYGYDNVSVDQIVADCGVAKGTFYHHFKSKDALMAQICSSIYDDLRAQAEELPQGCAIRKLYWFITAWHRKVSAFNLHFARQSINLYTSTATSGEFGEKVSQMEQGIELLHKFLTEAVQSGELSPATPVDTLAKALMFTMQGSTIYHCKHEMDFDVLAWNREFQHNILNPLLEPYRVRT